MLGVTAQLLPAEASRVLDEFGAVEHELASIDGDRFTVVVARGGDDIWIEVRRHRRSRASAPAVEAAPAGREEPVGPARIEPAEEPPSQILHASVHAAVDRQRDEATIQPSAHEASPQEDRDARQTVLERSVFGPVPLISTGGSPAVVPHASNVGGGSQSPPEGGPNSLGDPPQGRERSVSAVWPTHRAEPAHEAPSAAKGSEMSHESNRSEGANPTQTPRSTHHRTDAPEATVDVSAASHPASRPLPSDRFSASVPGTMRAASTEGELTRTIRIELPPSGSPRPTPDAPPIERLLATVFTRGATALYLTAQSPPYVRVDDDLRPVDGEKALSAAEIDAALGALAPGSGGLRPGDQGYVIDLAGVGRIRCTMFRDYRGPGAIFHLITQRPLSAERLGLSPAIQALATEAEGLVIVASPRGHGKSTVAAALVDVVNRERPHYVITLERQIRTVHESRRALVSQREVGESPDRLLQAARAALAEGPDVLVIEDVPSADVFQVALDAADAGMLALVTVSAGSVTAALKRLADMWPAERQRPVLAQMASQLRGAVAQLLLRRVRGGRAAAREVVVMTAAVAGVLADGNLDDLPLAIESGRKHGLNTMTDALVELVRTGVVDLREAYRKADDHEALVEALRRERVDTSVAERFA
jgi:twitching motility protein PilT